MIIYERKVNVKMPEGMRPKYVQSIIEEKFSTKEKFHDWYEDNMKAINPNIKVKVEGVKPGVTRILFKTIDGESDSYLRFSV